MRHTLIILVACAATALAAGASAAIADYDTGSNRSGDRSAGNGPAREGLSPSRLARVAYLEGGAEVDDDGGDAGDPSAKGVASFLQAGARTVCYGFSINGTDTPTKVHIHRGAAGTNGPPVIEFANVPKDAAGKPAGDPGASSGCKQLTSPAEIAALRRIRSNPGNYYVNVHTTAFPDGALRGQLAAVWFDNTRR